MFWVPGGVAMIYAIKAAGLAVAIGIGSSFIVLVSFTWGIFVFNERVKSREGAAFAIFLTMTGLWGMSYYSSPKAQSIPSGRISDTYRSVRGQESDVSDIEGDMGVEREASLDDEITVVPTTAEISFCGRKLSRRTLGLAAALFNGVWGGSIMVPLKFAP